MLSDSAVATGVVTTRCGSGGVVAGAVDAAANRKTTASANLSTRPSSSFVADARIDACSDTFPARSLHATVRQLAEQYFRSRRPFPVIGPPHC